MATFKVVILPHRSKTDKRYAVRIRLTHHRQSAFLRTAYRLRADEITASGKIKAEEVRRQLAADVVTMEQKVASMGQRIDNYSARELGDLLEKEVAIKAGVLEQGIDFLSYGQRVIESIKAQQPRQADNYRTLLRKISDYIQGDRLEINAITKRWLQSFERWMFETNGLSATSVNNNMRILRAIYNRARDEFNDEERGEMPIPYYPFGHNKYVLPTPDPSRSRALDAEVIRRIYTCPVQLRREELARDLFWFSFCMMGMNLPDIYRCTADSLIGDRLTYIRAKVEGKRGADAEISVRIPPEVEGFISKYEDPDGDRLFVFHRQYATLNDFTAAVNKGLKLLAEKVGLPTLSMYYARHSFATIAHSDCGASIAEVGACLNHAQRENRVTMIYTRKDYTRNDEIQRQVVKCVLGVE